MRWKKWLNLLWNSKGFDSGTKHLNKQAHHALNLIKKLRKTCARERERANRIALKRIYFKTPNMIVIGAVYLIYLFSSSGGFVPGRKTSYCYQLQFSFQSSLLFFFSIIDAINNNFFSLHSIRNQIMWSEM